MRVVNTIVDSLDLSSLYGRYKEGGCPAYHPRMMLKVMIYSYSQKVYSSRMIAKALRENVNFMWIAGGNQPDFRTVNRFRLHMKDIIEDVFFEVVKLLIEKNYIKLQNYFLDGTKIEANANKYSFVWNRSVCNYDRKLDEKIRNHLREIDRIVAEENQIYLEEDLEEKGEHTRITAEQVAAVVESIDKKLEQEPGNKQLKKKSKEFKKDILPRKQKYEKSLKTFRGRNSYSKTDQDATFMRMKEDAMLNGQLKPGYNIQIGTENRYIVGFTIHPNPTDTKTMIPHLRHLEEKLGCLPENVIADAGYGSEENYEYLEEKNVGCYVKYNKFHWEKKKKNRENPYLAENLPYLPESDSFVCRNGKRLVHVGNRKYVTEAGYETRRDYYRCEDCSGCPYKEKCTKAKGNKKLYLSKNFLKKRQESYENILSEKGILYRMNRTIQVEGAFGVLKNDYEFQRFLLRGKTRVKLEILLLSLGYNLNKLHAKIQNGRTGSYLFEVKSA